MRPIDQSFSNHCRTVWVDLDATLARYDTWKGMYEIGDPFPGAVAFMRELHKLCEASGKRVGILTVRTKADYPGREDVLNRNQWVTTEAELVDCLSNIVQSWLTKHNIPFHEVYTGQGKPNGIAYIDDKAVNLDPQERGECDFDLTLPMVRRLLNPLS